MSKHLSFRSVVAGALVAALSLTACSSDTSKDRQTAASTEKFVVPAPQPTLRLISQSQYVNTIDQIFGSDIAVKIRFAPVKRDDGLLAVGASSAVLTTGGLDPIEATARV